MRNEEIVLACTPVLSNVSYPKQINTLSLIVGMGCYQNLSGEYNLVRIGPT